MSRCPTVITEPIILDTNGGIWQGTGTFASPTTGLKLWNSGGVGKFAGYNGGTAQFYLDTDGKAYAGGGNVILDSAGISVLARTDEIQASNAFRMIKADGTVLGGLYGYYVAGEHFLYLNGPTISGESAAIYIMQRTDTSHKAVVNLTPTSNGNTASLIGEAQESTSTYHWYTGSGCHFIIQGGLNVVDGLPSPTSQTGCILLKERSAAAAPPADCGVLYMDVSGVKSRLMIQFQSGVAQQIAVEP